MFPSMLIASKSSGRSFSASWHALRNVSVSILELVAICRTGGAAGGRESERHRMAHVSAPDTHRRTHAREPMHR